MISVAYPWPPTWTHAQLFLGTSKYPRENTYKDLVNRNGGSSNASTSMDMTLYKFEVRLCQKAWICTWPSSIHQCLFVVPTYYHHQVAAECYESVLDVFSQFFIGKVWEQLPILHTCVPSHVYYLLSCTHTHSPTFHRDGHWTRNESGRRREW